VPVDPFAPPRIVVAHGVQLGTDRDLLQFREVESAVRQTLTVHGLVKEFTAVQFAYEDINDQAQTAAALVLRALTAEQPLLGDLLTKVLDIVGDVAVAALDTEAAKQIRSALRAQILAGYKEGRPQLLIAHSLGSVYALDVLCELMAEAEYFEGDDRTTWPVHGLVTLGSPLGLELFRRNRLPLLRNHEFAAFRWENYWSRLDPVVSGHVFGRPSTPAADFRGPVEARFRAAKGQGWNLSPNVTATGTQWVMAHTAYWKDPKVADEIIQMLWS
jgi:hypothetical protein